MQSVWITAFILGSVLAIALTGSACTPEKAAPPAAPEKPAPIPVIYDSDIGDDIDDTWALALLLASPELDVKLVVGDQGKARYRASLFGKFLETAGRTDVAVGIGLEQEHEGARQGAWIDGYSLESYPGTVHEDGVQAIIDTIMDSPVPVTLIAVGPLPNIAAALQREPRIAERARFVGMHGSVRLGYGGSEKISAEYNVRADVAACRKAFTAPWEICITPLDTCGLVHLRGEKYAAVRDSKDPVAAAVIENYRLWAGDTKRNREVETQSSTLFDPVAVYLAFARDLVTIEELGIRVNDEGFTIIDEAAKRMKVATAWKDMGAFEDLLVKRLTGSPPPPRTTP